MNAVVEMQAPALVDALSAVAAQPLWDRYQRITPRAPTGSSSVSHWRWATLEPLIRRACAEVSLEDAERRVLLMTPLAMGGEAATTTNLLSGLQTLLPGESARAHRHSLQAIRFVVEGEGAVTTVNEHRCAMAPNDLILTPAWTWHEHTHPGSMRIVWFDGLDLPLATRLDTVFFELAQPGATSVEPSPTRPSVLPAGMAVLASDASDTARAGGSRFRFAWERAWPALQAVRPGPDGSRRLRYVDGDSGGPVLPTLDCYLLAPGVVGTRRSRSTSNAVCLVVQGEGVSQVGADELRWRAHDVFAVPHWTWVSHRAVDKDAVLFLMTDREFLATLGYLREEESGA